MKITQTISRQITKWIAGAAMAGALILATPHQAQAQSFGVQVAVRPVGYGYYGPARYHGWHRGIYYGYPSWEPGYYPREHFYGGYRYHARYGWGHRY